MTGGRSLETFKQSNALPDIWEHCTEDCYHIRFKGLKRRYKKSLQNCQRDLHVMTEHRIHTQTFAVICSGKSPFTLAPVTTTITRKHGPAWQAHSRSAIQKKKKPACYVSVKRIKLITTKLQDNKKQLQRYEMRLSERCCSAFNHGPCRLTYSYRLLKRS